MATKKKIKKVAEKVEVTKVRKEEVKSTPKRILSDFKIAVLYSLCALCWIVSGILEYTANKKVPYLDICISIALIVFACVYFKKDKDSKK